MGRIVGGDFLRMGRVEFILVIIVCMIWLRISLEDNIRREEDKLIYVAYRL